MLLKSTSLGVKKMADKLDEIRDPGVSLHPLGHNRVTLFSRRLLLDHRGR